MNILLLASTVILAFFIARAVKKQEKSKKAEDKSFWERERQSNSVRKKSLDSLDYIQIPLEKLPMGIMTENSRIAEYQELIQELSKHPIVNLTGFSNTDLKLEYGTANITVLSEYDQNYTVLARTLQEWADLLLENNYTSEAQVLMEYAISTGTDVSRTYYKLAAIYDASGDIFQIEELVRKAEALRSLNSKAIVRTLREAYP